VADRPKFFDDLAGVAGGAISAFSGLRDEAESVVRAWIDEAVRRLDLVRREEFDAVQQLASKTREEQEKAEQRLSEVMTRIAALESRVASLETARDLPEETPQ